MFAKQTEYAIRAMVYIFLQNQKGKRPGFKEIAKEVSSPEQYLAKILQLLTRHELLHSMKGRGGGFFFPSTKTILPLLDIIRVTEGDGVFKKCGFGLHNCDADNPCPMHDTYMPVRQEFLKLVQKESIQSLAVKVSGNKAILKRINLSRN